MYIPLFRSSTIGSFIRCFVVIGVYYSKWFGAIEVGWLDIDPLAQRTSIIPRKQRDYLNESYTNTNSPTTTSPSSTPPSPPLPHPAPKSSIPQPTSSPPSNTSPSSREYPSILFKPLQKPTSFLQNCIPHMTNFPLYTEIDF